VLVLIWLGLWIRGKIGHVSTSDARVEANVITVSSRLDGQVNDFDLIEGDTLQAGDIIAQLYSKPARLKRARLQADVDRIQAQLSATREQIAGGVKAAKATLAADQAAVDVAKADMQKKHKGYERARKLYASNSGSRKNLDTHRYDYEAAKAYYTQSQGQVQLDQVAIANAQTGLLPGGRVTPPAILKTQLKIARAQLAHQQNKIHDLTVRSHGAGVVDKTFIKQGEYVSAGQPILMMHQRGDVWIAAKIKETDIHSLAVGQSVAIDVDAYPDAHFDGHVQVIGAAATNQFALLPNPNPSGNFTKITQRIPVRIRIDNGPKQKLAPGMMVEVHIDTTTSHQ